MTIIRGSYGGDPIFEMKLPTLTGDDEIDAMVMTLTIGTVRSKVSRVIRRAGHLPSDRNIRIDVIEERHERADGRRDS